MVAKTLKTRRSLDSKNNSESSGCTSEPNNIMGEDCRVTRNKRKACMPLETPRKRQRGACKPTDVAVVAVTARRTESRSSAERKSPKKKQRGRRNKADISEPTEVPVGAVVVTGTKRKTSTQTETPKKKKKRCGNTDTNPQAGDPTKVSVLTERKKKASAEQLPETSRTTRRESGCELSPSSSSPSASKENNGSSSSSVQSSRDFEAKYLQLDKLGEGGFGSVYAGSRKTDNLPVAIKHIPKADVDTEPLVVNGKTIMAPTEVILMLRVTGGAESVGKSAAVSLLDWYDLDQEVLLVMERPVPSVDLFTYLDNNNGPLEEDQAKNIMKQLVEAAIEMHSEGVFHRDIKTENVLVETGSDVPRVRVIDFGCGCLVKKNPYCCFSGTSAYAPPEFYIRGRYKAGPTTVWQLGALLYELLEGNKHFITSEFLRSKVTFLEELKELNVSQDCQDLLRMCLTVNPKERITLEQMQMHPWFT